MARVDTSTRIFGWKTTLPLAFAPSAMQRLTGDEGELGNVRAAVKLGLNMTLSSQSTTSLEDVMAAAREQAGGDAVSPKLWFQIYLTGDWEKNTNLIKRAEGESTADWLRNGVRVLTKMGSCWV